MRPCNRGNGTDDETWAMLEMAINSRWDERSVRVVVAVAKKAGGASEPPPDAEGFECGHADDRCGNAHSPAV